MSPCLDHLLWLFPTVPLMAAVVVGFLWGGEAMCPLVWFALGMWVSLVCHERLYYRRLQHGQR